MIIFDGPGNAAGLQSRVGQVVMLDSRAQLGEVMQFDKQLWGGFSKFKAIFTNISIHEATDQQFQKTLGGRIYLDVFGDDIGVLQISGLAFFGNCSDTDQRTGISHVLEYYRNNKLTKRANPIIVTIDQDTPYECYLHTVQGEMFGEQHTASRLYQFSYVLALMSPDAK